MNMLYHEESAFLQIKISQNVIACYVIVLFRETEKISYDWTHEYNILKRFKM